MEPGPRQTVDVVSLPGFGRGRLIWRNGPSAFVSDEGAVTPLRSVSPGGASTKPKRSWRRVTFLDGRGGEADLESYGENHSRWFSPLFGDGWLVVEASNGSRDIFYRFEDLGGNLRVRFPLRSICVGRPEYAGKVGRSGSRMPKIDDPDEMNWSTVTSMDGSVFSFRREGPPPAPGTFLEVRPDVYRLLTSRARKAYDAALKKRDEGGVRL